ncbi:MAG: precorrin-6Y C5,15-methyltransferase (decarboxylating) subunit CbiT, partial [Bacillota bacterium]|nr:precorrin-6Y C5,15-methyltransferase (decarboxylating) subunit CbiT [Bacillota bacterium]
MRDERFIRGGVPMTKREVRALAIDALELEGARSLVDIGAGTGSVSIQAAVQFPSLRVTSVERVEEGIELIRANADQFGVEVETIHREAPFDLGGAANAESSVESDGCGLLRHAP